MTVNKAYNLLKEEVEIEKIDSKLDSVRDKGFRLDILNAFFGSSA